MLELSMRGIDEYYFEQTNNLRKVQILLSDDEVAKSLRKQIGEHF